MKLAGTAGFTLVELLIGVVAAAILALSAGLMLVNTYQGWARGQKVVELEREAALAIDVLGTATRGANHTNAVVTGPDILEVTVPGNVVRSFSVTTSPAGKSLIYRRDKNGGGAPMTVVNNRLAASGGFVSSYDSTLRMITVTLALYDPETGLGMTVSNMYLRVRN